MVPLFLEGRGPFEDDPYFTEAREELAKMAREIALAPETTSDHPKSIGYLIQALSHWQTYNWDVHRTVRATKEDDNLLQTVFSFLPDHLMIVINGGTILLNSDKFNINVSIEKDGFTVVTDQIEYLKNLSRGKSAAGRRKITRKYQILMPYNWNMMQGALSNDGTIYLKVPLLQQS